MLPVQCPAQNYAWGRPAAHSEVASLAHANGTAIDESKPFAELWVGTHPSGPAVLAGGGGTLKAWLQDYPRAVGDRVLSKWGCDLPFLFKVLSVNTALSIQSHPDKRLAEQLHARDPKNYKDDNHKPEMALALRDFRALCGFVDDSELCDTFKAHPELCACVGHSHVDSVLQGNAKAAGLRAAFTSLMTCDSELVAQSLTKLVARLERESTTRELHAKEALVLELNAQYPADVGVLAAFFLNLVSLQPGEALYLPANEPHAYVSGELVECMATSDNVIRAGLTPKFRDTSVLCSSLTYTQGLPPLLYGRPVPGCAGLSVYQPPFDEFEVQRLSLATDAFAQLPVNQGPMMLLVQSGAGIFRATNSLQAPELAQEAHVTRGHIFFVPANTQLEVQCTGEPLLVWFAACNSNVFNANVVDTVTQAVEQVVTVPVTA